MKLNYLKYVVFLLLSTAALISADNIRSEYEIGQLTEFKTETIQFTDKNNKSLGTYYCIKVSSILKDNDYTLELISDTGRLALNLKEDISPELIEPIIVIGKSKDLSYKKLSMNDIQLEENEFTDLDEELNNAVSRKIKLSESIDISENSFIYVSSRSELKTYKAIQKIIIYRHL